MPGLAGSGFTTALGGAWGRSVARYFDWALRPECVRVSGYRPATAAIWACWHEANMLGLVAYPHLNRARQCYSFVPAGWVGAVAQGWVTAVDIVPAPKGDHTRSGGFAALRRLLWALRQGHDVVVAVDAGGPAGHVHPGALWLARASGCPLVPVGAAAAPVLRLPRWDRLMVPLPGARAELLCGPPIHVERRADLEGALRAATARALHAATNEARRLLRSEEARRQLVIEEARRQLTIEQTGRRLMTERSARQQTTEQTVHNVEGDS